MAADQSRPLKTNMNAVADAYTKLVLAMGQHDADYVDAFYGPADWKSAAEKEKKPLEAIGRETAQLRETLAQTNDNTDADEMDRLRREYLTKQLAALEARVGIVNGARLKFDDESRALYDAVAPTLPESHFQETLEQLETYLKNSPGSRSTESGPAPGNVPLWKRYEEWRKPFIIPREKLDTVFQLAIKECRSRTLQQVKLPESENFTVEYVTDKPWSGYNWYQGNFRSVIQVNTDLPIYIDRAVDLAAHEGYPGHHVYNALLEEHLVRERAWTEFTVYPLFSPQSLIAEGTANFGKEVVFTKPERMKFEQEVLFPAAGIDPARAEEYYAVQKLVQKLAYARNEAARRLVNEEIKAEAAEAWLQKYALMDERRAKQSVKFIERYGSYVINYNLGEDLVRAYIEKRSGGDTQKRWREFERLLSSPRLPSGLN